MGYQALYRMYRPARFEDVVGQTAIIRILKNQVMTDRVAHAYLFSGPRGVGKTSVARIFARAINCTQTRQGEACGECDVCRTMAGENMDILEIDAASNNGVDDIRELRENVGYAPAAGRFRVYIIDEVHMLSTAAFNALLKTLEEPPAHGVFILATTQPQKLPDTVLSRCQRFDFTRIPGPRIVEHLKRVLADQHIDMEERGIHAIARAAEGGVRDAMVLLEQCMAAGGDTISAADVYELMGTTDQRYYFALADAILAGDTGRALKGLDSMFESGCDAQTMAAELMRHFRDLFIVVSSGPEALFADDTTAGRYVQQAAQAAPGTVLRILEILSLLEGDLRYAGQPRVLIELAAARCCRQEKGADYTALLERIEKLEKALEQGAVQRTAAVRVDSPPVGLAGADADDDDDPPWEDEDDEDTEAPDWNDKPEEEETEPQSEDEPSHSDGGVEAGDGPEESIPLPEEPGEEYFAVNPEPEPKSLPETRAKPKEVRMEPPEIRTEPKRTRTEPREPVQPKADAGNAPQPAASGESVPIQTLWNRVMAEMSTERRNDMLISLMQQARPVGLTEGLLEVAVPPGNTFIAQRLSSERNSSRLARHFSDMLGRSVRIKVREEEVDQEQREFIENSMRDLSALTGRSVTVRFDDNE